MAKIITKPGDTVVILDKEEAIKPEWNVFGTAILRKIGELFAVEKDPDEILDPKLLG
jgi:hypothetical protein